MPTKHKSWKTVDAGPKDPTAAHIVIATDDGRVLLLRRTGYDYAEHWGLPGGGIEPGEDPEDAVIREVGEETGVYLGFFPEAIFAMKTVTVSDGSHTFGLTISEEFEPVLNREHDAYLWASKDELPSPMHPNAAKVILAFFDQASA